MNKTGPDPSTVDLLREKTLAAQENQMLRWWPTIEVKLLESLRGELKDIVSAWEKTESGTQARLKHAEALKQRYLASADQLSIELKSALADLESIKKAHSQLASANAKVTTDLESARAANSQLTTDLESAQTKISELQTEASAAHAKISELQAELKTSLAQTSAAQTRISELQAQASASSSIMKAEKRRIGLLLLLLLAMIGLLLLRGT